MKNFFLTLISLSFLLISGCGHNVITDYEVTGLDLSIPIFGYPFGIKLGKVKVNSNMVRGNASYSSHNNTSAGQGTIQKASVIQFSSNTQINEGNVENIIRDKNVDSDVKSEFIKNYLSDQKAPEVLPVSSKTPTTATVSSKNTKIHETKLPPIPKSQSKTFFEKISPFSWIDNIIIRIGDLFLLSSSGKIILFLLKLIAGIIVFLFIRDIFKKIISLIKKF